jgi:hypothetical protein
MVTIYIDEQHRVILSKVDNRPKTQYSKSTLSFSTDSRRTDGKRPLLTNLEVSFSAKMMMMIKSLPKALRSSSKSVESERPPKKRKTILKIKVSHSIRDASKVEM